MHLKYAQTLTVCAFVSEALFGSFGSGVGQHVSVGTHPFGGTPSPLPLTPLRLF